MDTTKNGALPKYMSYDLAGKDDDFEFTNLKTVFQSQILRNCFPFMQIPSCPLRRTYQRIISKQASHVSQSAC
jgi:hypothetical protein